MRGERISMQIDTSKLKEIDSPIKIDENKSKYLSFHSFTLKEDTVEDRLERYMAKKRAKKSDSYISHSEKDKNSMIFYMKERDLKYKFQRAISLIITIGYPILMFIVLLYAGLDENTRNEVLKEGYQWFPVYENMYILSYFLVSFTMIFVMLIFMIWRHQRGQITSKNYSYECLRYRELKDYVKEGEKGAHKIDSNLPYYKKKGFYFKALDMDWDIYRLFALDIKIFLVLTLLLLFTIFGILSNLAVELNSIENDPSYNVNFLGFLLFGISGVLILGALLLKLTRGIYNYMSIKNQVKDTIEERQFLLDAFLSTPSLTKELTELEHLKMLQLQNKLYRVLGNIKQSPKVPLRNWHFLVYGIAIFTAVYPVVTIFLDLFLQLIP